MNYLSSINSPISSSSSSSSSCDLKSVLTECNFSSVYMYVCVCKRFVYASSSTKRYNMLLNYMHKPLDICRQKKRSPFHLTHGQESKLGSIYLVCSMVSCETLLLFISAHSRIVVVVGQSVVVALGHQMQLSRILCDSLVIELAFLSTFR